jgi:RHS repeat-associated protein
LKAAILDIETHNSDWQKIDYRPFTEGVVRRGFGGDIFDIESGFIRMGARLYEPETGRFTSVDPLFEAFKRWSPYAYSYNSPLTFRDPTVLAPEKEKYKDEIDFVVINYP